MAVAGGANDGTSGVREAADKILRGEIESFADIIFASSPAQRDFWLGRKSLTPAEIRSRFRSLKPCLHGSDGHGQSDWGAPDEDRFSWVKGGFEFDTLRQACIDPAGRAFVGPKPPDAGPPSESIGQIEMLGATWAGTPKVALNPGLIAIIGPRGSGKTALAEVIALACDAAQEAGNGDEIRPSSSFLKRAHEFLQGSQVRIKWRSGETAVRALDGSNTPDLTVPRARYLSQQFVEQLCSSTGMTDALIQEIERVVFDSHPLLDRDGTLNFTELLELRSARYRQAREREDDAIATLSDGIGTELEKHRNVGELSQNVAQKKKNIANYEADRSKLVAKGSEERVKRLTGLLKAADVVRGHIRFFKTKEQALQALQDEVADLRATKAPELLRQSQLRHTASRMKPDEWDSFLLDYTGDVDTQLSILLDSTREESNKWKGTIPRPPEDLNTPLIPHDADLSEQPLALLEAEIERLQSLVNSDLQTRRRFAAATRKIDVENVALGVLKEKLEDANGAKARAKALQDERKNAYRRVFDAIVGEQKVLSDLYAPLMTKIGSASGTLQKLNFTVSRTVDVRAWARIAEEKLIDLRRQGPFKRTGSLQDRADKILKAAWESGDSQAVQDAMEEFSDKYHADLLKHANVPKGKALDYRAWLKRFAKWLYSTSHVKLRYSIDYDGVDIRSLSPGTRGIVLLLLYLALDDADDRPLIIDQPEENLDPKSVFDELVNLFVSAKSRRQVIIVTHNANLVINTDADQIIIADAEPHLQGQLPKISYTSGGMENAAIRKSVVDILEGGADAFKERARRLRVGLQKYQ